MMKKDRKVFPRRRRAASFAAEPFRRVANLRKIRGDRVFCGTARGHIAVTALPQRKFAQSALPSVCRKTCRRS
jgi:hypothetical protein